MHGPLGFRNRTLAIQKVQIAPHNAFYFLIPRATNILKFMFKNYLLFTEVLIFMCVSLNDTHLIFYFIL